MKAAIFALPLLLLPATPLRAEDSASLPPVIIGAPPATAPDHPPAASSGANAPATDKFERCVDVVIGHERSFDCMNEKLKRQVDRVNPPVLNTPPIDARSQDLKVGVVNVPAVQQQYGKNFGVSAFPYRPPPPVYAAPTVSARPR
jgi:hypothetical protein